MSLRKRLEQKARRRTTVPVQISDPSEDLQLLTGVHVALQQAQQRLDTDDATGDSTEDSTGVSTHNRDAVERLRAQAADLETKVREHWVQIELQSLPPAEWEAVCAAHQTVDVTEDGPQVTTDWSAALAPILSESCTDPELRGDVDWWQARLSSPEWTEGDHTALRVAVLSLNVDAVGPKAAELPKG